MDAFVIKVFCVCDDCYYRRYYEDLRSLHSTFEEGKAVTDAKLVGGHYNGKKQ
jgi:hypothetical protein